MSKYRITETEYEDREALLAALGDLGYSVENGSLDYNRASATDNSLKLQGYGGDTRPERANIRIPKRHVRSAANDVGFSYDPETGKYQAIISDYDTGQTDGKPGDIAWSKKLKQRYSYQSLSKAARKKGYKIKEKQTQDGTIRMELIKRR